MRESIFKGPALVAYLVKRMSETYPDKQVGKTVIQKLLFLLTRTGVVDFDYGAFNAVELSIITTALFVRDSFGVSSDEELVQVVASLKTQYSMNLIVHILKDSGVVQ